MGARGYDLDVVVVGAGIAGLASARALTRLGLDVAVVEAAEHIGGRMQTTRSDGYTLDLGADLVLHGYTTTRRLLQSINHEHELEPISTPLAGMWRDGRIHVGPSRLSGFARWSALSPTGRLRSIAMAATMTPHYRALLRDSFYDGPLASQTVGEFGRQCGQELLDYLLEPTVSGLYGWDVERSSVAPFLSMVSKAGRNLTAYTYRSGMDALCRGLRAGLDVRCGWKVKEIAVGEGVVVRSAQTELRARAAVVAVPAPLLDAIGGDLPMRDHPFVKSATYSSSVSVTAMLSEPILSGTAYGIVFPRAERTPLRWLSIEHNKSTGRVPPGRGMIRIVPDPSHAPFAGERSDVALGQSAVEVADRYVPGLAASTTDVIVHHWSHALPEMTPANIDARRSFARRPLAPIAYAGDWLCGPSAEHAAQSAAEAVDRVTAYLARTGGANRVGALGLGSTRSLASARPPDSDKVA